MRKQETCRACKGTALELMFSLGEQSLTGFHLAGEEPRRGPLDMMLCRGCGLAQLGHTYPGDWFYDWYGYRSGTNPKMARALGELAERVAPLLRVGDSILDIGSNDGTFLRLVGAPGIRRVGVDPVKNLGPVAREGLHLFVPDYFTADAVREHVNQYGPFRVVTMTAMFYELEDPVGFLREVRSVLADDGLIVIQMNYLASMLERNGYDNIVHEHQTYFSLWSLLPVLEAAGFTAVDVEQNDVNGGSFRVWAVPAGVPTGGDGAPRLDAMLEAEVDAGLAVGTDELETDAPYKAFWRRITNERAALRAIIDQALEESAAVYVYGASTRGLAIMEFTGLNVGHIVGAAERNVEKYGRLYGGTGIPCVPEAEARERADYFLVLPHHFLDEFVEREADWLAKGGLFIVPLPRARLVGARGVEVTPAEASS